MQPLSSHSIRCSFRTIQFCCRMVSWTWLNEFWLWFVLHNFFILSRTERQGHHTEQILLRGQNLKGSSCTWFNLLMEKRCGYTIEKSGIKVKYYVCVCLFLSNISNLCQSGMTNWGWIELLILMFCINVCCRMLFLFSLSSFCH